MARGNRRAVITGIGVVSSIGVDRQAFARALRAGAAGIKPIASFDTEGYPYAHAAEIQELAELTDEYRALIEYLGRSSAFAVLAAREATLDAGLDQQDLSSANAGAVLGTTDGESQVIDEIVRTWLDRGADQVEPAKWRQALPHRISSAVADDLSLPGESMMVATACAAGNYAIGYAADVIASGEADVMLCGGADSVCRKTYSGFFRLGAITPDVCRPFDANRRGLLTGEGAAVLVLESMEHATDRSATLYAEVLGYGSNCDAHHMVVPHRESIAECIRIAHRRAGITPDQVDYIGAHGTGTKVSDAVEAGAIHDVFGDRPPPASSIKSMIGHTMGAACPMTAVATVIAMHDGFLPPTMNFVSPDDECRIDCVPNEAREETIGIAEVHGFAFGGNNAVVVLKNLCDEARGNATRWSA